MHKECPAPGFTLTELLISLLITAVLVSATAPTLTHLYRAAKANTTRAELAALLNFARYTALVRRQTVTLCPATADLSCGEDWSAGIIVYLDSDEDGRRAEHEEILRVSPPLEAGSQLTWRAFRRKPYLQFTSSGVTRAQNGRFSYCPPGGEKAYWRQLIVHKTGRARPASTRELSGSC